MQDSAPNQQSPRPTEPPRSFLSGQGKLLIAVVLLIVALGYFAYTAFQGATIFYFTVGELLDGEGRAGESLRVNGKLVPDSFQREAEGTLARFSLTDGQNVLPAVHQGILPELFFNPYTEIVLQGVYGDDGVFRSQQVIVKCPSKYAARADEQGAQLS